MMKSILFFIFHHRENGTVKFLTKGDNNSVDDRGLYAPGQLWLTKNDIVGRARGVLPYVGMITIYMNEYPNFKVRGMRHIFIDFPLIFNHILYTFSVRYPRCSGAVCALT